MRRTRRRDEYEQARFKAKKLTRSLIRMKFSLMADDVINDVIPQIDETVERALETGTDWRHDVKKLISDAVGVALPEGQ